MLTYKQCAKMADTNGAHGSAVEGHELELFSLAYMRPVLEQRINYLAKMLRATSYNPRDAWVVWMGAANEVELSYSAPALAPGMPGFKPAARHSIDKDGRRMAALYMERRWRAEVFKRAGIPIPVELVADCDPEEV